MRPPIGLLRVYLICIAGISAYKALPHLWSYSSGLGGALYLSYIHHAGNLEKANKARVNLDLSFTPSRTHKQAHLAAQKRNFTRLNSLKVSRCIDHGGQPNSNSVQGKRRETSQGSLILVFRLGYGAVVHSITSHYSFAPGHSIGLLCRYLNSECIGIDCVAESPPPAVRWSSHLPDNRASTGKIPWPAACQIHQFLRSLSRVRGRSPP